MWGTFAAYDMSPPAPTSSRTANIVGSRCFVANSTTMGRYAVVRGLTNVNRASGRFRVMAEKAPGKSFGSFTSRDWSDAQPAGCGLGLFPLEGRSFIRRTPQHRDAGQLGQRLLEQLEPLPRQINRGDGRASDVPSRPREARDEPALDRVVSSRDNNWDRLGCLSCGIRSARNRDDDVNS